MCFICLSLTFVSVIGLKYFDIFMKSNIYTAENAVITTKQLESKLLCFSTCVQINRCSFVFMKLNRYQSTRISFFCQFYEIINYKNLSLVSEPEVEIWYKKKVFLMKSNSMAIMNPETPNLLFPCQS